MKGGTKDDPKTHPQRRFLLSWLKYLLVLLTLIFRSQETNLIFGTRNPTREAQDNLENSYGRFPYYGMFTSMDHVLMQQSLA
ncbi:hypothetical protein SLEP1_g55939 [Rubroshorea leprosula]|uniref:Uncharacterized protein n=1 Tax=Rubroshorea leprosula TaxID=152421 RepID=A0AAV5MGX5_9ROSI|nr:hypothetical protein SLEP1_g55939 [Rubroshorea leprosula]